MAKITYGTKAPFQNNPDIPKENKCTADDLNEIKNVVNQNYDDLETAKANIEELQNGQGTSESDITSLKNRISALETDNTNNKSNITNLQNNKVDKIEGKGLSTEDFTTALKTKLEKLQNYDDTEIKKDIEEIKTEQTAQNKKIEQLDDNQIHITTEKADNLNVKDASGQNAKINVFGISKQETRSGKNKFNIDNLINVTEQNVQTGSFVASNLYGTTIINNTNLVNLLKPNTNYKCIANVTLLEKPATITSNYANILTLYKSIAPSNNIPVLKCSNATEKNNWQINETKQLETVFATDNDLNLYNMLCYCYANDTEVAGKFKFENIMILEATEDDESFEQYGASPSPKYSSNIENTTGNVKIMDYNKNFLGIEDLNHTSAGLNWQITDNEVKITGTTTAVYSTSNEIECFIPAGSYKFLAVNGASNLTYRIWLYSSKNELLKYSMSGEQFTLTENAVKYRLVFDNLTVGNTYNTTFNPMILLQTETDEEFEAHEEQVTTFPLQEGQKMYEGSYTADDGIHHKRNQIELDGTENWFMGSITSLRYSIRLGLQDIKLKTTNLTTGILSNCFLPDDSSENSIGCEDKFTFRQANGSKNLWFFVPKNFFTTTTSTEILAEWKAYLSAQKTAETPVVAEYEIEEETIEEYTEKQQEEHNQFQNAKTYKTETNVFTENAEVEMEYVAHTKTYIDNKVNNMQNQLNTINELLSTTNTSALLLNNLQTDLESEVL